MSNAPPGIQIMSGCGGGPGGAPPSTRFGFGLTVSGMSSLPAGSTRDHRGVLSRVFGLRSSSPGVPSTEYIIGDDGSASARRGAGLREEAVNGPEGIQARSSVLRSHRPDLRRLAARMARAAPSAGGGAERAVHRPRRHGLRPARLLRESDQHAASRRAGRRRAVVYEPANHGAVLGLALAHARRTEP